MVLYSNIYGRMARKRDLFPSRKQLVRPKPVHARPAFYSDQLTIPASGTREIEFATILGRAAASVWIKSTQDLECVINEQDNVASNIVEDPTNYTFRVTANAPISIPEMVHIIKMTNQSASYAATVTVYGNPQHEPLIMEEV